MILSQALITVLSKSPNAAAIRFLGKDIKCSELAASVARISYLFQKELKTQQRVAFIGSNSPAAVVSFFALSNTRSLFIPIDPSLSDDDIAQWIYDSRPTHILATSDHLARVQDLARRRGISIPVLDIEKKKGGEYSTSFVPQADQVPKDQDPVLLLRTAGTAGKYKYALFSHAQVQAAVGAIKKMYRPSAQGGAQVFLTTQSWAHPFAFVHGMLFPVMTGATCLVHHGLEGLELLDFISKSKATRLVDAAYFFQKLLMFCLSAKRTLTGVQSVTVALGELSAQMRKVFSLMKIGVSHCHGQTENLWTLSMSDPSQEDASQGQFALAGIKYKAVDDNGDTIESEGIRDGQLAVSGPTVMMRYDCKDEKEQKRLTQEAIRGTWLYTGDVFRLEGAQGKGDDKELKLKFQKRKDGLTPRFAPRDQYDPSVIESVVRKVPGITAAAVFQDGGLTFCAVVKVEDFAQTEFQLLGAIKPSLTPRNIPSKILFVKDIPYAADGTLDVDHILGRKKPQDAPQGGAQSAA